MRQMRRVRQVLRMEWKAASLRDAAIALALTSVLVIAYTHTNYFVASGVGTDGQIISAIGAGIVLLVLVVSWPRIEKGRLARDLMYVLILAGTVMFAIPMLGILVNLPSSDVNSVVVSHRFPDEMLVVAAGADGALAYKPLNYGRASGFYFNSNTAAVAICYAYILSLLFQETGVRGFGIGRKLTYDVLLLTSIAFTGSRSL
jgi:hypothetical protein